MAKRLSAGQKLAREGAGPAAERGLGEMPLTLWVLVAGIILYLYIRRANLGIDTHPGEGRAIMVQPKQPSAFVGPPAPVQRVPLEVNQHQPGQINPYAATWQQFLQWIIPAGPAQAGQATAAVEHKQ